MIKICCPNMKLYQELLQPYMNPAGMRTRYFKAWFCPWCGTKITICNVMPEPKKPDKASLRRIHETQPYEDPHYAYPENFKQVITKEIQETHRTHCNHIDISTRITSLWDLVDENKFDIECLDKENSEQNKRLTQLEKIEHHCPYTEDKGLYPYQQNKFKELTERIKQLENHKHKTINTTINPETNNHHTEKPQ